MDPDDQKPPIDDLVDQLLRDQDLLMAREIRKRVDELNQILAQAREQKLRIKAHTSEQESDEGDPVVQIEIRIFREI